MRWIPGRQNCYPARSILSTDSDYIKSAVTSSLAVLNMSVDVCFLAEKAGNRPLTSFDSNKGAILCDHQIKTTWLLETTFTPPEV